ncbi:MAG: 7-cyano-7-deazaguanine synthase [Chloroflexota bacterium]
MTSNLFLCDGAVPQLTTENAVWDNRVEIRTQGSQANLKLEIDDLSSSILSPIDALSADIVRIASYVYAADQSVSRGTETDVYGSKWTRQMHFVIPVSDPSTWGQEEISLGLSDTLSFLTGDNFTFEFAKGTTPITQSVLPERLPNQDTPDCVVLFSGGADSLCAVIEKVAQEGRRPILVSHRSLPLHDYRQTNLVTHLRARFNQWHFPHISIWVNLQGCKAEDYTQRSRSFLYTCLAIAISRQSNIKEIFLADNGIVSANPPTNAQLVGTTASRTTHPKFLYRLQQLAWKIYQDQIRIENPLAFKTRAETLEILKRNKCCELLEETVSCAHSRQSKHTPHCGVCSQCVDRRFATCVAQLEKYDPPSRYKVDIFNDPIEDGVNRTLVVSYIRFAKDVEQMTPEEIFKEYTELEDCIIPGDRNVPQTAKELADLLRRHAMQVSTVVKEKLRDSAVSLFEASLPESCLIRLIASGEHSHNPRENFAIRLVSLLQHGIPKIFQSHKPEDENEVQEATDGILASAKEDLDRELPLLSFASISTKPDFSRLDPNAFYIEMKYIKERKNVNRIVTEITSRISVYQKQGAYTLFAVYDPHHCIPDDQKFAGELSGNSHLTTVIR